ncbi:hypothetical protein J4476_06230 [Candidatus Woesearchaeota archaeon]|nr:hypothetical protein [Candidatus Woesearchaeota archaeon]
MANPGAQAALAPARAASWPVRFLIKLFYVIISFLIVVWQLSCKEW